jgi:Xaa-Pro dipeptidase
MTNSLQQLIDAENKALVLFEEIESRNLVVPGKSEKELNLEVYELAQELLGIKKFWHKRIVRAGANTLLPYRHNPPNLILNEEDILFFDFGPVFEDWEADIGKTMVLGSDQRRLKLKKDVELAWQEGRQFYLDNRATLTGASFYAYIQKLAKKYGWEYGNEHCGHLVGNFPHEKLLGEEKVNYLHPENTDLLSSLDKFGQERFWILEIHFVDSELKIGGFYERLLYDIN